MLTQPIQLDLFVTDPVDLKKLREDEISRKNNKQIRFLFHKLGDLEKKLDTKTPQAGT